MYATLTEDENALLTHVSMWGSDGYPVHKLGRGWTWEYRGIKGPPVVFKTKRAAVESFERYHECLIDKAAGRNEYSRYTARCQPYKVRTGCGHIVTRMMREATAGVPYTPDTVIDAPNGRPCDACEKAGR